MADRYTPSRNFKFTGPPPKINRNLNAKSPELPELYKEQDIQDEDFTKLVDNFKNKLKKIDNLPVVTVNSKRSSKTSTNQIMSSQPSKTSKISDDDVVKKPTEINGSPINIVNDDDDPGPQNPKNEFYYQEIIEEPAKKSKRPTIHNNNGPTSDIIKTSKTKKGKQKNTKNRKQTGGISAWFRGSSVETDQVNTSQNDLETSNDLNKKIALHKYRKFGVMTENRLFYHKLDHSEYTSKFAVIDNDTIINEANNERQQRNIKNLTELLFRKQWGLKKPKLLISVTGSAMNFQMKPNLRSVFRRGIAQAAKSTQAWILTGGTHAGVMKHVGDAMHEYSAWQDDGDDDSGGGKGNDNNGTGTGMNQNHGAQDAFMDIPVIGFSTYETLTAATRQPINDAMDSENVNSNEEFDIEVPADRKIGSTDRGALLDRNHTHFLLFSSQNNRKKIENDENPDWGQEIKIWSLIEEHIITNWDRDTNRSQARSRTRALSYPIEKKKNKIPALLISIQGGPGTLDTILNHFKMNIPMVAIRSSGGWTDVICDICGKSNLDFQEIGKSLEQEATIFEVTKKDCNQLITFTKKDGDVNYKTSYETIFLSNSKNEKFSGTFTGEEAIYAVFIVEKLMQYNMTKDARDNMQNKPVDVTHVKKAIDIYMKKRLVTIFELTDKDNELDTAMMKAVLSAQQSEANLGNDENAKVTKIYLAIDYDKAELIRDELYNDDAAPLKLEQLGGIFDQAILFRKPKFINLLLDMDFDYKTYITREKLLTYYESMLSANKNSNQSILNIFRQHIPSLSSYNFSYDMEGKFEDKFDSLKYLINEIESYIFGPEFTKSFSNTIAFEDGQVIENFDDQMEVPLRHLLFWAAMLGDFKVVEVVYVHLARYEGGGIIAALALATIFKRAARAVPAIEQSTIYRNESLRYEQIAVDILTKAYHKANIKSALIVGLPSPAWGNMTPLKMAIQSHARNFVSQQGFQEWLNIIWYDRLEPLNSLFDWIKLSLLTIIAWIPYVLELVHFRNLPWVVVHTEKRMFFEKQGWDPNLENQLSVIGSSEKGTIKNPESRLSRPNTAANLRRTVTFVGQNNNNTDHGSDIPIDHDSETHNKDDENLSLSNRLRRYLKNAVLWKDVTKLNFFDKMQIFYSAPCTKFVFNAMSMFVLIWVYAYFLLLEYCYVPGVLEIVTFIWMTTIFLDEVRQFHRSGTTTKTRWHYYFSDKWNKFDILVFVIYLSAVILRTIAVFVDPAYEQWKTGTFKDFPNIYGNCTSENIAVIDNIVYQCDYNNYCPLLMSQRDGCDLFFVGQVLYCIGFITLCLRFLNYFSLSRVMGPLIITIARMMVDVMKFVILLVVLMIAFGVSSSSLLYPNDWRGFRAFLNSVYRSYITIYGELLLEEHSYSSVLIYKEYDKLDQSTDPKAAYASHYNEDQDAECYIVYTKPNDKYKILSAVDYGETDYDTIIRCPQGRGLVDVFLGFYTLITTILLLNLLIALFTTTYDKSIARADQIWKFQRTELVKEYRDRPRMPPPIILFSYIKSLLSYLLHKTLKICGGKNKVFNDLGLDEEKYGGNKPAKKKFRISNRNKSEIIFSVHDKLRRHLARLERVSAEDTFAKSGM